MSFAAGHRSGATKTGGVVAPPTRPAQQSHGFQKLPAQQQQQQPQSFHNNTTTMTRPQSQHQPQHQQHQQQQQQQDYSLMFTNFLSDLQQQFQEAVQIADDLRSKELEPIQNEIALVMAQIDQLEKENQSLEEVLQHALEFKQQNGPISWGSAFLNDHPQQQQQQHPQQHHQQHDGNTRHGQYYGNGTAGLGGGGFDPNNMRETFDDMDQFYPQSQNTQTENTTYRPDDGDMGDGNQPQQQQQQHQKDQDQLPPLTETKTSKQDSTSQANNKAGDTDVAPVAKQSSSSTKTGDKDSKKKDRATK